MQISLKWVGELLNLRNVDLYYLIDKLTLGGFEVEKVIEVELKNEKLLTLDLSATANRSDSLSIKGMSKEISTLLNKPYQNSKYLNRIDNWKRQFNDLIYKSPLKTNYLSFLSFTIEGIKNFKSPKWLKEKLIQSGFETFDNFIDFQNYIILESGYPLEVYDLTKIVSKLKTKNFNLHLIKGHKNEKFTTFNNFSYFLDDSILTLKADQVTISVAGIAVAKEFIYSDKTTSLLIEASIFKSKIIRQQSRSLGLKTDRSSRYEKSIKANDLINSVYRLIRLLKVENPNLFCKIHTKGSILEEEPNIINLKYITVNEILGPLKSSSKNQLKYISPILISRYLSQLKFDYNFEPIELMWQVKIPNFRNDDINRSIDLVEEIGRLHGFNKFLTTLPLIKSFGIEDESYKTRKKITATLLNNGFNELIHYSLINDNIILTSPVEVINPLLMDSSNLRVSLLPTILKSIQENLKQRNGYIDGFEYGHIFSNIKNKFNEEEFISGIFGGTKRKISWANNSDSLNWFEAKGKIDKIFKQFNCFTYWKSHSSKFYENILHPYKTAEISFISGTKIGIFGQINPILAKKLNISIDLYLFEFNFDLIKEYFKSNKLALYNEYSLYPKIVKDLSFLVNKNVQYNKIEQMILTNGTKVLKNVKLLDQYQGLGIPENQTSLCLQLTFQSKEKTLQTTEVEQIIKILNVLLFTKFNCKIRE
jgi:phenylalanyl-tRNA synthetase beta chain